ncbi:MAG: hypothetical protein M1827_001218 [Pycnora praestabilis]|nr:MAG: hypothetical protein M1827_001218 [Pycnora praestabilis]
MSSLPYHEPPLQTLLSLTSFLLLLNTTRHLLDSFLYCGLVGEILIGVIWGLPVGGTAWLSAAIQQTVQAFGYLGLIGSIFEGGLSTDIWQLRKTKGMAVGVATVLGCQWNAVSESACYVFGRGIAVLDVVGDDLCDPVCGRFAADENGDRACWGCDDQ